MIHGSNKSENQKEKTNSTLNSQPHPRHSTPKGKLHFFFFPFSSSYSLRSPLCCTTPHSFFHLWSCLQNHTLVVAQSVAFFFVVASITDFMNDWETNGRTDDPTNGRTDELTNQSIEFIHRLLVLSSVCVRLFVHLSGGRAGPGAEARAAGLEGLVVVLLLPDVVPRERGGRRTFGHFAFR